MDKKIDLNIFSKSKFRMKFHLDGADIAQINEKGLAKIESHAKEIIIKRLAPSNPQRDGKQTPFKGHPVFKAQHATATCCRGCLSKWHRIDKGRELTSREVDYIVSFIMKWIENQMQSDLVLSNPSQKNHQLQLF